MSKEVLDDDAVLSDVDDDDANTAPASSGEPPSADDRCRVHNLLAELEQERRARKAAEGELSRLQSTHNRLKAFAQDVIRKRDDALREKEDTARSAARAAVELAEAVRQKDALRSEVESAAQMLVSGIEKFSGKVADFKNFSAGGLPRSEKHTGMPAVAYGVVKRADEIVEELVKQIDAAAKSRDAAREQVEQRNYEIAIEVSELEATIGGLREEVSKKGSEIERLEKLVTERDAKIYILEMENSKLRQFSEDFDSKSRSLETKIQSQRPLLIGQLNHMSKAYEQIHDIIRIADAGTLDQSELLDSLSLGKEMDVDENLQTLFETSVSIYKLAKVAVHKVREKMEEKGQETRVLRDKVDELLVEKQHVGTLLRSALSSKTDKVLEMAENVLREAGIDLRLNGHGRHGVEEREDDDEVYTLAGALQNTVKASQLEIVELQHLVEALRAESSLLKAHVDSQAKEISQQKQQIKELKEKDQMANESVEGLLTDIAAAEEEIVRWKTAAEQEAAAGRAVEQEFLTQLSTLRQELNEAKQALINLENKLKFKEETAAAAMTARDAAEKSLRLADLRSTRLRERLEELTQQLEKSDNTSDSRIQNSHRYVCWPWQWPGLNFLRYHTDTQGSSNEMELSEPLI
ncbi:ELKS/Rab6-interacting/CAST family member 1-like isoform X1 [Phoenix dactylifera]|uniref:ELKS/Rab6-interacting/CAST family member 1-like isoform X1 n=1 Tax=Phoenix dactylifera TaxID=42345 RepID=A0A8B9A060_PHODC|nr:ELKS/Rab6-interacting/CAST family member 1-like isoform X1 [Phoenix dactylifera]